MQPEKIILIPPTHEQSTPSFHVEESLLSPFMEFLRENGIGTEEPVAALGHMGPKRSALFEIRVHPTLPVKRLERMLNEFLKSRRVQNVPSHG